MLYMSLRGCRPFIEWLAPGMGNVGGWHILKVTLIYGWHMVGATLDDGWGKDG